eukprot:747982-Hanusia_phi.AAC.6
MEQREPHAQEHSPVVGSNGFRPLEDKLDPIAALHPGHTREGVPATPKFLFPHPTSSFCFIPALMMHVVERKKAYLPSPPALPRERSERSFVLLSSHTWRSLLGGGNAFPLLHEHGSDGCCDNHGRLGGHAAQLKHVGTHGGG